VTVRSDRSGTPNEPQRSAAARTPLSFRRTPRVASWPISQLFSDRTGRRRADRDHLLSDLVVRELGRQPGATIRALGLSAETYLPFGLPGSGLIVAVIALTLLGFSPQTDRPDAGGSRRKTARAHARGARDLSRLNRCSRRCSQAKDRGFRRVASSSFPRRDVVDRADLAGAEP